MLPETKSLHPRQKLEPEQSFLGEYKLWRYTTGIMGTQALASLFL